VIHGILAVDKPQGWTSHDVVARIRKITAQRQVGHAGTLDPLATGVLLVLLGRATRLSSYLMAMPKTYLAEVVLGASTATDDAEAPVSRQQPVPPHGSTEIEHCLERFVGRIEQVPPAYAAIRQGGERLYRLARRGLEVEVNPRTVDVYSIELLHWHSPRIRIRVTCGSGTYIRSLARDIGASLGTCAYLHALRRTASGSITALDAVPLAGLTREGVDRALETLDRAVLDWPAAVLDPADIEAVTHGRPVLLGCLSPGNVRLYGASGELVALARGGDLARPFRVFVGGEELGATYY
jgi:tRNA pseudouridine55 synthase